MSLSDFSFAISLRRAEGQDSRKIKKHSIPPVRGVKNVADLAGPCPSITLHSIPSCTPHARALDEKPQQEQAHGTGTMATGDIRVTLTRAASETQMPSGLELSDETMQLTRCAPGSAAAKNAYVRGCIGMVLGAVDDGTVHTRSEVAAAMEGVGSICLHFHPWSSAFDKADAPAEVVAKFIETRQDKQR